MKMEISKGILALRMPFKLTSPSAEVCIEIESQMVCHIEKVEQEFSYLVTNFHFMEILIKDGAF